MADVKRVCAHAQALAQCRGWLDDQLPDVERVAVSSNAEGARRARDERGTAAIASRAAAEIYGLTLLANDIEDRADNTTRFSVVGRKLFSSSGADRTTLLVSASDTDDPGALFRLLEPLAEHRVNMTRIESRPSRKRKWDYVFFIDVEGHVERSAAGEGAGLAREAREPVQGARVLPASRALMGMRTPRTFLVRPSHRVAGALDVPGDKSISHRSLMLVGDSRGHEQVSGFLASEDCLASLAAMRALGVRIEQPDATRGAGARRRLARPEAPRRTRSTWAMPARRCGCSRACLAAQSFDSQLIGDASLDETADGARGTSRCARWAQRCAPTTACRRSRSQAGAGCTASTIGCRSRARR